MTSSASLHFGPEWMRKPARMAPNSPNGAGPINPSAVNGYGNGQPLTGVATAQPTLSPATTATTQSSYSSLLASPMPQESKNDSTNPFRYSREQMLNVWKNGGGGALGRHSQRSGRRTFSIRGDDSRRETSASALMGSAFEGPLSALI
jgi:PERQ amino acid-rich with GYF domain-containing protein